MLQKNVNKDRINAIAKILCIGSGSRKKRSPGALPGSGCLNLNDIANVTTSEIAKILNEDHSAVGHMERAMSALDNLALESDRFISHIKENLFLEQNSKKFSNFLALAGESEIIGQHKEQVQDMVKNSRKIDRIKEAIKVQYEKIKELYQGLRV